jgi:hypothetical protein
MFNFFLLWGLLAQSFSPRTPFVSVLDIKSQYIPEVVVVRRGAIGVWGAGEGGVGQLGGGYKRGQFTSNLRRGRAVPVTSGGSQVSGRGHKEGRKGG